MDKITENANNLAKELVSTSDVASYIQVVNPTTGKVSNMKISDLASVVAGVRGNPSNRIIASSTISLNKGESFSAKLPCFGIYIIGNAGLTYGNSGLIFAYTNVGVTDIAGDSNAFIVNVKDYTTRTIEIINNVNVALKLILYSLY